jgi:hypothetical protein
MEFGDLAISDVVQDHTNGTFIAGGEFRMRTLLTTSFDTSL